MLDLARAITGYTLWIGFILFMYYLGHIIAGM